MRLHFTGDYLLDVPPQIFGGDGLAPVQFRQARGVLDEFRTLVFEVLAQRATLPMSAGVRAWPQACRILG